MCNVFFDKLTFFALVFLRGVCATSLLALSFIFFAFSQYDDNADFLRFVEIESFCNEMSFEKDNAQVALSALKIFLNTADYLIFERLKGGSTNAPIAVFKHNGNCKIPFVILKQKLKQQWAELDKQMAAIDEMRQNGFECLPRVIKSSEGQFLVNLGESSYSCLEYLAPDAYQPTSIEEMFKLTSQFHSYSKNSTFANDLRKSCFESHCLSYITDLDPELIQWDPSFFQAESWRRYIRYAHYFTSSAYQKIYQSLPSQLIHGDISTQNIIFSKGKPFFIDFDHMRTDVRLLDFAIFCGWNFLEQYLTLIEENKLFSCIKSWYGDLEESEKNYLSLIVLFVRFGILNWSLKVLKESLVTQDHQAIQVFRKVLTGTLNEINQMCSRIPHIQEIIDNQDTKTI